MQNWEATLLSQYANSPILTGLISSLNSAIDPSVNITAFYNDVWNIASATGHGLDVWGRIVNISRNLTIPGQFGSNQFFGFNTGNPASQWQPFGQAPFWDGSTTSETYALSDSAYQSLILFKAFANIAATNIPTLNQLIRLLMTDLGNVNPMCYVADNGNMLMTYVFQFALTPYELAIVNTPGLLPHPTGVGVQISVIDNSNTFGFNEMGGMQPFNYGTLLSY